MATTRPTPEERLAALKVRNQITSERQKAALLRQRGISIREITKGVRRARGMEGAGFEVSARYNASTRTRLRPGARPSGGSASAHLTAATRDALARDCQDLERNSPVARIIIRRAQQLITGDGAIVRSACKDKAAAARYDAYWNGWADACDPDLYGHPDVRRQMSFHEMLAANVSAWCTDGDVLFLRIKGGSLQMVEAERIVSPGLARTLTMVDGVELDAAGAAAAFHVAEWDAYGRASTSTRRVPAEHAWLSMNPIGVRAGFVRGEPALQAVLTTLERLDSYIEKVGVAAEIATLFGAIITDDSPAELQDILEQGTDDQPTATNANAPREVEIAPGTIKFMGRGGNVTQIKPEFPTTSFSEYVRHQIMLVGAELGIPLVASLYDSSQMSWSNIKAVLSLSSRSIEPAQARLARFVRWVRTWKIQEGIRAGDLPARDDFAACTIEFPRAPVIDFRSEVEGYKAAVDARFMTRDQAIQALGTGTFGSVSAAGAAEEKALAVLGIPAIQSPGAVTAPQSERDSGYTGGDGNEDQEAASEEPAKEPAP